MFSRPRAKLHWSTGETGRRMSMAALSLHSAFPTFHLRGWSQYFTRLALFPTGRRMAAPSPDPYARVRRSPQTVHVTQNDVQMVDWPPVSHVRYLVTAHLNSCTAIAIVSPQAAILAHIAALPDGTTEIRPGTNPGPAHVQSLLNRMMQLYNANRAKFNPAQTFVIAGIWNQQPAMEDGIRLVHRALQSLGLSTTWKNYPVLPPPQPRPEGFTSVVIEATQPGLMPQVDVNSALLN
ncbi:hypothetical protein BST61_g5986 [Cercospora zeina]